MREVITPDGRTLAVEEWGVPDGTPVFYLHGTPMSRLARHPDDTLFTGLGIRLITFDRPGFGGSTARPGRRVVDGADDVAAVADASGSAGSPSTGSPAAARTPWPSPPATRTAPCASPRWPRSRRATPTGSTGRPG